MSSLLSETFDYLVKQGSRAEWLERWLLKRIWTTERYHTLSCSEYLNDGEAKTNELEEVIAHAAYRIYDEFLDEPSKDRNIKNFVKSDQPFAVVIFDGLSLREIPVLLDLSEKSNFAIKNFGVSNSALPSDTIDYIDQKLGFGNVAPSQLPGRRDIREKGFSAYYYDNPNQQFHLDKNADKFLLWSAFPDNTYSDSGARFTQHFEQIHSLLETAWINIVQQVPRGREILITSDHGYVFFGPGLSFARSNTELRPLTNFFGGERYKRLDKIDSEVPKHPDLVVYHNRNVAILRGRVQTHPPGRAASRLYKHGGLSIMEMLVPWIVLAT